MKIKLGSGASVSSKAASSPDAIKCMTYHASKGLEFKAVIVTELNASVKADKNSQILFDARNGFVSDDYIEETVRLDESIEMMAYKNNQLLYDNAEILRLLYVDRGNIRGNKHEFHNHYQLFYHSYIKVYLLQHVY